MVRLQPLQARLDRRLDVLAVEARLAATDIGEALSVGADDLGGDDNLAAGAARGHPVSDDLLGAPISLRAGVDGIHLGGVDEVNALIEIGRAPVCTPVTNAHLVCRLL